MVPKPLFLFRAVMILAHTPGACMAAVSDVYKDKNENIWMLEAATYAYLEQI